MNRILHPVYVGLGSNLEDPRAQLQRAFGELRGLPGTRSVVHSALYGSEPLGPPGQPDYINAVAMLSTVLAPLELLEELQSLEQAHRRIRSRHWGPRTLDLDILLYGDQQIDLPGLRVPHPHMHSRNFVLAPLYEIAPDLVVPGRGAVRELLAKCEQRRLKRLE